MNIDRKVVEQALRTLEQAKTAIADWGEYADEYYQRKYDLQGDIDEIQAQITALRAALEAEQPDRATRIGAYVLETAKNAGWKDDGEGAYEYIQRMSYAQGVEDAGTAIAEQPAGEPVCDRCGDVLVNGKLDGALCCDCALSHDDLTAAYMSWIHDGKKAAMAAQQSEKPVAWQNPLHLDQLSDKKVPNWRPLYTAPQTAGEPDQRFLDLLCLIHGDGGHYIAEHGLDKAAADAVDRLGEIFLKARSAGQAADHIVDANKMVQPAHQDDDIQPDGHFLDDVYGGNTGEVYVYDTNFSKGEGFYKKIPIVPLTDAEIVTVAKTIFDFDLVPGGSFMRFARAIELAHGIGGAE
jgi:hypothetical protein